MWIFDIKRFAIHDGPGIRTTVFLKGCPLNCRWCHNPESQTMEPVAVKEIRKLDGKEALKCRVYGRRIPGKALLEEIMADVHFYETSGGGVTFSGGEPLQQAGSLEKTLKACKGQGVHTAVDTSGHAEKEVLERIVEHTDLFLYDLKIMDPDLHLEYTGVDNKLILSNADFLLESGAEVIFRIPVVPGINTTAEERTRFLEYLERRKGRYSGIHLLPYHRAGENKYRKLGKPEPFPGMKETGNGFMLELQEQFINQGLTVDIGG